MSKVSPEVPPLNSEQKQQVLNWFQRHAAHKGKCPICDKQRFTVADYLAQPPISDGHTGAFGPRAYFHYMLICGNCANTIFLDAQTTKMVRPA